MFPRLGQMIVDYETPVKKLSEEFIPHAKVPPAHASLGPSVCLSVYLSVCLSVCWNVCVSADGQYVW